VDNVVHCRQASNLYAFACPTSGAVCDVAHRGRV
jgi:hypothetical protein